MSNLENYTLFYDESDSLVRKYGVESVRIRFESTLMIVWVVLNVINILSMQLGFALLEAGTVKKKHQKNILIKYILDGSFGALGWFSIGFGIYSAQGDHFVNQYHQFGSFFVGYAFAISSATIVSGAIACRMKLNVYMATTLLLSSVIFPILGRIVWDKNGFLYGHFVDYAGSVVVHGMGGSYAFVAAYLCGPRTGRFSDQPNERKGGRRVKQGVVEIQPSSPALQTIGGMMLWVGWFAFNGVGLSGANQESFNVDNTMRSCMNTLLSSSFSASVGLIAIRWRDGYYDLGESLNCLLAGSVAITGCAAWVDLWAGCLIGCMAGLVYIFFSHLIMFKLKIDDPLNAAALHGACGALGGISTGIFHRTRGLVTGDFLFFLSQILYTLAIQLSTALVAFGFLGALHFFLGGISCTEDEQLLGLDFKYHGSKSLHDNSAEHMNHKNDSEYSGKLALVKLNAMRNQEEQQESGSIIGFAKGAMTPKRSKNKDTASVAPHCD